MAITTSSYDVRGGTAVALVVVASAACGSAAPRGSHRTPAGCADLSFEHRSYDEWHEVGPHGVLQEVGDAFYPACNKAGSPGGDPLAGKGSTDVWQYDGTDASKAVIGLREDTDTYVVFVRVGVDPKSLGN